MLRNNIQELKSSLDFLEDLSDDLQDVSNFCVSALNDSKKIIFAGNGGSAAESDHLSAELIGRFKKDRRPLKSISLASNSATLTAITNDYDFKKVFSRQLIALGEPGDVLIAMSTSGNSQNIVNLCKEAKSHKIRTVGFTGNDGGQLSKLVDQSLIVKNNNTARIQECHLLLGHTLCDLIEIKLSLQ